MINRTKLSVIAVTVPGCCRSDRLRRPPLLPRRPSSVSSASASAPVSAAASPAADNATENGTADLDSAVETLLEATPSPTSSRSPP